MGTDARGTGPSPNLAQLEALIAIVDHGSFTAAAEALRISQPSLSRRIRSLEDSLGARLFLPVGRGMELTGTGRSIVASGRRVLGEMSSLRAMAASARELETGRLRLTGLPSLVSTVLTDLVGSFHREHPGVRIEIFTVEDAEQLIEAIRVGRADAAAGVIGQVPDDLAALPLPSQEFAAVLPDAAGSAPAEATACLSAQHLEERTLVTLPPGTSIRRLTDSVYRSFGREPARIITTTQRDSLVPLSVAVEGITVVPDVLARTAPALGGRGLSLHAPVQRPIGIIHRHDELQSPALRRFLALARPPHPA